MTSVTRVNPLQTANASEDWPCLFMSRRVTWAHDLGCSIGTRVTRVTRVAQSKSAILTWWEETAVSIFLASIKRCNWKTPSRDYPRCIRPCRVNLSCSIYISPAFVLCLLSCPVSSLLFCVFSLVLFRLSYSVSSLLSCVVSLVLCLFSCSVSSLLFCVFSLVLCLLSCFVSFLLFCFVSLVLCLLSCSASEKRLLVLYHQRFILCHHFFFSIMIACYVSSSLGLCHLISPHLQHVQTTNVYFIIATNIQYSPNCSMTEKYTCGLFLRGSSTKCHQVWTIRIFQCVPY